MTASGTGNRAPRGPKTVDMLTPEHAEPTTTSKDPKVCTPSCPDRESDSPESDSAGTQASCTLPSCLRGRRKRRKLRSAVARTPSPVLFSLNDQTVPQGEEECEEEMGYLFTP